MKPSPPSRAGAFQSRERSHGGGFQGPQAALGGANLPPPALVVSIWVRNRFMLVTAFRETSFDAGALLFDSLSDLLANSGKCLGSSKSRSDQAKTLYN